MKFSSSFCVAPVTALAVVTTIGAAHAAFNELSRSASSTSCRILGTSQGQRSIRGLLARQWIVGYASGIIVTVGLPDGMKPIDADTTMAEVRRYCRKNPDAMAGDAVEAIFRPYDRTR